MRHNIPTKQLFTAYTVSIYISHHFLINILLFYWHLDISAEMEFTHL